MDTPYEALSPDRVLTILEGEGYALDAQLMALNSYENRVYQVGQGEGARHAASRSPGLSVLGEFTRRLTLRTSNGPA